VAGSHAAHVAMNIHFLLSGYLFYWVVIGVDPTPRAHSAAGQAGDGLRSLPLHPSSGWC
jgi:putative copper resistance protein D